MTDAASHAEIRKFGRAARHSISPAKAERDSSAAALLACGIPQVRVARHVATYRAHDAELDTGPLDAALHAQGATVWHPVVDGERLLWARFTPGAPEVPGDFGIDVPISEAEAAPRFDVVVVPLVAVDPCGNRVGHGRGFYDRAFATTIPTESLRLGFAFDEQVVDRIVPNAWDAPMHLVVTPTTVHTPNQR